MRKVVISQPMYFPWYGIFEQLRLCDCFVHYDDVQLPQGRSFISRVQLKSIEGSQWLTVPVRKSSGQLIRDVRFDDSKPWRETHLKTLQRIYTRAPFVEEMLNLAGEVYGRETSSLSELNIAALEVVAAYFDLQREFVRSSELQTESASTQKLLEVCAKMKADIYITGHGARHYLDCQKFEDLGIQVMFMDYERTPYPQLYGEFDPHVSILDLIANTGRAGIDYIVSGTKTWKEFIGG